MITIALIILIVIAILLMMLILIQNPKGGGLMQSLGGISNQWMGVRRTTDFLEKGTWTMAIAIFGICLLSAFFAPKSGAKVKQKSALEQSGATSVPTTPSPAPAAKKPAPSNSSTPGPDGSGK